MLVQSSCHSGSKIKGKQMHKKDHRAAYVVKTEPIKNSSCQQNKDCMRLDPALPIFCTSTE